MKKLLKSRGRSARILWVCLGCVALTSIAAVIGEEPRFDLFKSVRSLERQLGQVEAEVYAPQELNEFENAYHQAIQELAVQEKKVFLFRNYALFNGTCAAAHAGGLDALRVAEARRIEYEKNVCERLRQSFARFSDARSNSNRYGLSLSNRSRLTRAELLIRETQLLAQSEKWIDAERTIGEAEELLSGVNRALGQRMSRFDNQGLIQKWSRWVGETVDESLRTGRPAIVVDKSTSRCLLIVSGRIVSWYPSDFGTNGIFDKTFQGDGATPEGKYRIIRKNPSSKFYKALLINYPNETDIREYRMARLSGRIRRSVRLGGEIEIHGHGGKNRNWTQGCIALRDIDIADLYRHVDLGTPVTIVGRANISSLLASAQSTRRSNIVHTSFEE